MCSSNSSMKLAYLEFSSAEQLSINLQSVDLTVQEALNGARLLRSHLESLCSEEHFDHFYELASQESYSLTNEPCLPRQRKAPKRYDEGSQPHYFDCPKSRYRHSYYDILDLAAGEIERRFTHDDLKIVTQIEELLINAGNGVLNDSFDPSLHIYLENDIDLE